MEEYLNYRKKGTNRWQIASTRKFVTEIELRLGIYMEEIDPLMREAAIILVYKGYYIFTCCQGHEPSEDAYIEFKFCEEFPEKIKNFFEKYGQFCHYGFEISHENKTPQEFRKIMTEIAIKAPKLGDPAYWKDHRAEYFRYLNSSKKVS